MNGGFGFFQCYCYDNVFVCSQIIGFDDDWCVFFMQISQGWFNFGEILVFCCWNLVMSEEIFGECFGVFQLCGFFGWVKDFQVCCVECIDYVNYQWCFWVDDGQINFFVLGKVQQCWNIGDVDSYVL